MLVKEFKQNMQGVYSDAFLDSLPDVCFDSRCNAPTEMSETLTGLCCSNPRCPAKIARRLLAVSNSIGVKDLGAARANAFVSKFGIDNPLLIFGYEPDNGDGEIGEGISLEVSSKIAHQFLSKNSFTLWEYVRLANLPFIQSSALQIFGDYDDLEEAYADIEQGGVDFIQKKLNIAKGTGAKAVTDADLEDDFAIDSQGVSIRALKVYQSLMMFKQDLFQALPFMNIIKTHSVGIRTLKAVCSDEVGEPFRTKADFYSIVNNTFESIHVEFLSSATKGIDYLIWAGADGEYPARVTNKVQKIMRYNESYEKHKAEGTLKDGEHYIPIVTATQFLSILDEMQQLSDADSISNASDVADKSNA